MDRALPTRGARARLLRRSALVFLPVLLGTVLVWQRSPHLQTVSSPQLATVVAGEFRDELPLRARVEPLHSVQLDAPEAGRVESVMAHDGDWVVPGTPLYRLHSPEQEQLLMQRSAEVAQQMANVSAQRSAKAASLAANRRDLAQLQAAQQHADAEHQRQAQLAEAGYVSAAALEQVSRQRRLATQLWEQASQDMKLEEQTRQQSIDEMASAVAGLRRGLQLLERSRERLLQRAPMAGQLSGFNLQVGASVRPGDRLGRVDDPTGGVQLVADVDEFFLPRLHTGQTATSTTGELTLMQTLPQVQGGKARVLLRWPDKSDVNSRASLLRPGQTVEIRLQMSTPSPALLLPEGPGVQTQLYVRQRGELQRRTVELGRRAAGQVEVRSGLQAGDSVLISQPPSNAERLLLP